MEELVQVADGDVVGHHDPYGPQVLVAQLETEVGLVVGRHLHRRHAALSQTLAPALEPLVRRELIAADQDAHRRPH
jgi:hypothetical protein